MKRMILLGMAIILGQSFSTVHARGVVARRVGSNLKNVHSYAYGYKDRSDELLWEKCGGIVGNSTGFSEKRIKGCIDEFIKKSDLDLSSCNDLLVKLNNSAALKDSQTPRKPILAVINYCLDNAKFLRMGTTGKKRTSIIHTAIHDYETEYANEFAGLIKSFRGLDKEIPSLLKKYLSINTIYVLVKKEYYIYSNNNKFKYVKYVLKIKLNKNQDPSDSSEGHDSQFSTF